jgi:hypothetical protein
MFSDQRRSSNIQAANDETMRRREAEISCDVNKYEDGMEICKMNRRFKSTELSSPISFVYDIQR